jgi:GGDEF domain-containing protein
MGLVLRRLPRLILLDARESRAALGACERLKLDSCSAVAPAVVLVPDEAAAMAAFAAGADEVILASSPANMLSARMDAVVRRAERDLHIQPTTLLPGPPMIEREIRRKLASGAQFAVCYVDLDHFKEYNDRYSFAEGDRIIRMVARILHDVVIGTCGERGFVGHIGGDDFICVVPPANMREISDEVIDVFDTFIPYQYSEQDRRAGYYFGKDRRGQLHRVPLMTVSIGIVTNERRSLTHPAQVSQLATEMKSYAKTRPGSVYVVDRRQDGVEEPAPQTAAEPLGGMKNT